MQSKSGVEKLYEMTANRISPDHEDSLFLVLQGEYDRRVSQARIEWTEESIKTNQKLHVITGDILGRKR